MEKFFNETESLEVIHQMIQATKEDIKKGSFYYLFWGWLILAAAIGQFVWILYWPTVENSSLIWLLLMPAGVIVARIRRNKEMKKEGVKTYTRTFLKWFWLGFSITVTLISFTNQMPYHQFFSVLISFYGLGLFVSGGALKFRPLQLGGVWCWVCSTIGFQLQSIHNEYILLLLGTAVLGGYIVPGYILKYSKKSEQV